MLPRLGFRRQRFDPWTGFLPVGRYEIDPSNPIIQGGLPSFLIYGSDRPSVLPHDLSPTRQALTVGAGTVGLAAGPRGATWDFAAGAENLVGTGWVDTDICEGDITFFAVYSHLTAAVNNRNIMILNHSSGNGQFRMKSQNGSPNGVFKNDANSTIQISGPGSAMKDGGWHSHAVMVNGSDLWAFGDGLKNPTSTVKPANPTTVNQIQLGGNVAFHLHMAAIFPRALSDAEVLSLHQRPAQLIRPTLRWWTIKAPLITPTPDDRVYAILADPRALSVHGEDRIYEIPNEDRGFAIEAD